MENSDLLCNCFAGVQAIQLLFDCCFCCPRRLVGWLGGAASRWCASDGIAHGLGFARPYRGGIMAKLNIQVRGLRWKRMEALRPYRYLTVTFMAG